MVVKESKEGEWIMDYSELIKAAEGNLKVKGILKNYSVEEGSDLRSGPETNFVGYFNRRYFECFGFKFRMIDSREASTEVTLFNQKFKTPIFCGALSGLTDITEKPLVQVAQIGVVAQGLAGVDDGDPIGVRGIQALGGRLAG